MTLGFLSTFFYQLRYVICNCLLYIADFDIVFYSELDMFTFEYKFNLNGTMFFYFFLTIMFLLILVFGETWSILN